MDVTKVRLADAVEALRSELSEALKQKPETGVVFTVQTVEVELQVIAETNSKGELSGGWSLLGWNMGGKAESGESQTGVHKVRLTLDACVVDEEGEISKVQIASESTNQR